MNVRNRSASYCRQPGGDEAWQPDTALNTRMIAAPLALIRRAAIPSIPLPLHDQVLLWIERRGFEQIAPKARSLPHFMERQLKARNAQRAVDDHLEPGAVQRSTPGSRGRDQVLRGPFRDRLRIAHFQLVSERRAAFESDAVVVSVRFPMYRQCRVRLVL